MDDNVKSIIGATGAMAELLGLFMTQLIKNGFTRDEALVLCQTYLNTTLLGGANNKSNN